MSILEGYYQKVRAQSKVDREINDLVHQWWVDNNKPPAESLYQCDHLQVSWLELAEKILTALEKV